MQVINWFVPATLLRSRTNRELAQMFVSTHLIGAVVGMALAARFAMLTSEASLGILILLMSSAVLGLLPLLLRWTGDLTLAGFISFQALTVASLVGTYDFGGFGSPFLPWLLVSLMTGLFYLSRRSGTILLAFAIDLAGFVVAILIHPQPTLVSATDLTLLGWMSIAVAMLYMALMALYYSRVTANRAELQIEADRYRTAMAELEEARATAEQLSRNRSAFFSKMSHELRTPLNAIIGYSDILLEDCEDAPAPSPQRIADLKRINSTGKHLLSLVSDVLDVSDIEQGKMQVELSTFSLGELCDAVTAAVHPMIVANGNSLVVDCPLREDRVTTDDKKLRQMLINLLSNAAKFTSNGQITLEMWVERGLVDDRLHAAVVDTGIGIAPDVLPRLFKAYMQADASVQGKYGGTGLGLALTRKFGLLLGGDVTAFSRPGEGARFTIDIPADLLTATRSESRDPDQTVELRTVNRAQIDNPKASLVGTTVPQL
jgi:signal transduction histidine kinase